MQGAYMPVRHRNGNYLPRDTDGVLSHPKLIAPTQGFLAALASFLLLIGLSATALADKVTIKEANPVDKSLQKITVQLNRNWHDCSGGQVSRAPTASLVDLNSEGAPISISASISGDGALKTIT